MMNAHEVIDGATGELLPAIPEPAPANLFGVDNPMEIIDRARSHARALDDVIRQRNLYKRIGSHDHILVEGWTLLGSMVGVFPVVAWTRPLEQADGRPGGWEARVEARTLAGRTVGAGEAMCSRDENTWKNRDEYALRSMAQTRATSKALRGPLGFIVQLAGYNPTPYEEMPSDSAPLGASTSGNDGRAETAAQDPHEAPSSHPAPPDSSPAPVITDAQLKKLWAEWRATGIPDNTLRDILRERFGVESTKAVPKSRFNELLTIIHDLDSVPF
jgi:hypothetical protein